MAGVSKEKSEKAVTFAKGGNTPMFGHQNSDTQQPGGTSHHNGPEQSQGTGDKFAKGGNTSMFGHQNAGTQKPGGTAHDNGPEQSQGTGNKFAEGGKGKMFGFTGSLPASAGITSAR